MVSAGMCGDLPLNHPPNLRGGVMMMTVKTRQAEGTRVRGHEEEAIGYGVRKPPPCPRFDLLLKGQVRIYQRRWHSCTGSAAVVRYT